MKTRVTHILILTMLMNTIGNGLANEQPGHPDASTHGRIEIQSIVGGNTQFAFDLYQQLKDEDGNLFFSPYSISTALAMTYAGAREKTAEQMAQTLHFPILQREFAPTFGCVIERLNQQGQKGDYLLSVANALWAQKDYPFLDSFVTLNKTCYKAGLENVDFVKETEKSRQTINQWVEDRTQQKIKDLIPQGTLNEATRLVLTNAIYFKGDWASAFDPAKTQPAPFHITSDKQVTAAMMSRRGPFEYGQTQQVKILKMPYKGDDLAMVLLLPRDEHTLAEIESQLTAETFTEWAGLIGRVPMRVFLPKFKMTSQFRLNPTLAAMGMPDAFNAGKADFSGMTGSRDLFLSAVLHKAFVEVNETGTEAAAATSVGMELAAMPARPVEFRADRPFLFVIQDNTTGSILFIGRVTDPTAAQTAAETTADEKQGRTFTEDKNGNFTLYVSNQSFAVTPVDIQVYVNDQKVIERTFDVTGERGMPQHNWIPFRFQADPGTYRLRVESKKGKALLNTTFEIKDKHWAAIDYWNYPKNATRPEATGPKFTFTIQDQPIGFM